MAESAPVFYITDLLPHFAGKQREKKLKEAIKAEQLNVLVGSRPAAEENEKEKGESKAGDSDTAPVKKLLRSFVLGFAGSGMRIRLPGRPQKWERLIRVEAEQLQNF